MRPLTASTVVDVPRERVFNYLCDLANHAEFSGHYVKEFRLERLDSRGVGAAARFLIDFPLGKIWAESVIDGLEQPHLISIDGQMGRLGRIKTRAVYRLTQEGGAMTRVEYTFSAVPGAPGDRLRELLGLRMWLKAQSRKALRRLTEILEEDRPTTHAATVAAG